MIEFRMKDVPEELLRVADDGTIHSAGRTFGDWAEYVRYVAELKESVEFYQNELSKQHGRFQDLAETMLVMRTKLHKLKTKNEKLRDALEDIAEGNANIPDELDGQGIGELTNYMWLYSQGLARKAIRR